MKWCGAILLVLSIIAGWDAPTDESRLMLIIASIYIAAAHLEGVIKERRP